MHDNVTIAEVVTNGRGRLFAQVAKDGEYTCWALSDADICRFRLRIYDEIQITAYGLGQLCNVIRRYEPEIDSA